MTHPAIFIAIEVLSCVLVYVAIEMASIAIAKRRAKTRTIERRLRQGRGGLDDQLG